MFNRLKDLNVKNKTVFVRADMNISIKDGEIIDDTRIKATIPTIEYLVKNGAKAILTSHLGSPKGIDESLSLKIVLKRLQILMPKVKFNFSNDCIGENVKKDIKNTNFGEVILLENLRFHPEEELNDENFSKELASLAEIYVNDAFSTCHRKHSSMVGIPEFLPAYAGFTLEKEIENLTHLVSLPEKPVMVIVGGSKVSTKLELLKALVKKYSNIVVGGGMANTFLYALGKNVGNSLKEPELAEEALNLLQEAKENNCNFVLPTDVIVTEKIAENQIITSISIDDVKDDDIIVDLGEKTLENIKELLNTCKTLIWNGPVGIYEIYPFNVGTDDLAEHIARLTKKGKIKSVAGGGDILAALNKAKITKEFTYVSTAGGAFLKWLEKGKLPAVEKILK